MKARREERDLGLAYLNGKYRVRVELGKDETRARLEAVLSSPQLAERWRKLPKVCVLV